MLTRLKVDGFKNLVDVDIRFGPFTCIAGANGVGKSNLFDAIQFLGSLADLPFIEAALRVRDEEGRSTDIKGLFHRIGNRHAEKISFEAEMIVPPEGRDNLGQLAKASTTFLRYRLELSYREGSAQQSDGFKLEHESLTYITKTDSARHLLFKHSAKNWRSSLGIGNRRSPFITTDEKDGKSIIKLHQDGRKGLFRSLLAETLPRTVLSDTNASESPTALLARIEMRSWRLLQLEPTALRKPDEFTSPSRLGMDGAHLAKSLYALAHMEPETDSAWVYGQITNRLAELLDDVREVKVDRDEKRELLTLMVAGKGGTFHPARALSDGTLRFLVLSVLELEKTSGVLCFEEPENGIHPQRIGVMLELLQDIALDTEYAVDQDNPLRQVIINTHSPTVVSLVPAHSLVVAELVEKVDAASAERFQCARYSALPDTWRMVKGEEIEPVSLGRLLSYLNPISDSGEQEQKADSLSVRDYSQQQLNLW